MLNTFISHLLMKMIKGYQSFISPIIPGRCRFYPTCSEYGKFAIQWHGATKGSVLTIRRICRCHPLGGHGIDFVPLPLYRYRYQPITCDLTSSSANYQSVKHQALTSQPNNLVIPSAEAQALKLSATTALSTQPLPTNTSTVSKTTTVSKSPAVSKKTTVSRETKLVDRGVYKDHSSYVAILNALMTSQRKR